MNDQQPSREQLLEELADLHRQVALLKGRESGSEKDPLEHVLGFTPVLICVAGLDGYYKRVNPAFERLLGYTEEESLGRPFMDFIHPDDRAAARDNMEKLAAGETVVNFEDRNICKDGSCKWLSWTVVPVPDEGVVYGIGHDITERKQAEEALATSEAKWRSLVENAPDVIVTVDREGTILFINNTLSEIKREEVIGKPMLQFVAEEYHRTIKDSLEKVFCTGQPVSYENRPSEAYGSYWFSNRVGPVKANGEVVAATVIATDITERKRMEKALQEACEDLEKKVEERTAELGESEAKFRTLFESTNDAVMLLDDNEFFECNDATLRIFGCSTCEQFIGKHPTELSPPTQPDGTDSQEAAREKIALAIKTGKAQFEWLHRRLDGTEFMADVLLSSMDLKGKTVLQAVVRDISQRKKAEEAVLRERETLRRLLESSDRERKLTAYEIHDGFTQQVAGAKMQLEVAAQLKDANPEAAAEAYQRGLELLGRGMDEARRLISGLRPPILDEVGVVAAIEHLTRDPGVQEGPEIGFVFNARFGRLQPLLENAIFRIVQESVTNARRYSESGKVQIRLAQRDGRVCIEVQDWGVGFDPNEIARTSFGIGGIKERARLLGGHATIDSAPGKGTLVRVELPLVESR